MPFSSGQLVEGKIESLACKSFGLMQMFTFITRKITTCQRSLTTHFRGLKTKNLKSAVILASQNIICVNSNTEI